MYKELAEKQTAKAQQQIQSQANTFGTSLIPSAKNQDPQGANQMKEANFNQRFGSQQKKRDDNAPNWRMGRFNDHEEDSYLAEQMQIEKNQSDTLFSQLKIQEKPMSKHAQRRKKKKGGQVVASGAANQPSAGASIMNDADPSLDDVRY